MNSSTHTATPAAALRAVIDPAQWFNTLAEATAAAASASDPEAMIRALIAPTLAIAGDRDAWTRPGSLKAGERQFYVGGCFIVTPDEAWHMLVGNVGLPRHAAGTRHAGRLALDRNGRPRMARTQLSSGRCVQGQPGWG